MLKSEIQVFFTALQFYTRIPCPPGLPFSQDHLDRSSRYFPLMGWIVGGIAAACFYLAQLFLPVTVAVLLSMAASILATGAFHEDGFADTCDGFGGGYNRKQVLEIMKDSRIGTFGTIGLILILLLKFLLLDIMPVTQIPLVLIVGHSLSRWAASLFKFTHTYVREEVNAKAKPMAQRMTGKDLLIATLLGLLPCVLLKTWYSILLVIPVWFAEFVTARYMVKRIGGYTGDCLGAVQQICEVTFYLSYLVLWKFI